MGLATAPGAFQETMSAVLSGLNWIHAMVYVDDILIFTPIFDQHLEVLDDVFQRLIRADLKVKLNKCEFSRTELKYLGHILDSAGIRPDPAKISAVEAFPPPTTLKEVETFLGKAGYYCRFIKDFSKVAHPLFHLKKKTVPFSFGEAELNSFLALKKALCEAPVLRHPDFERPFILQTDASGYGLGAVLTQEFDDGTEFAGEHPIAYASRTLKDAETRYSTIEKEALGIFWGIKYFEQYLACARFKVVTDHKPLIGMMKKPHMNTRIENYALRLQHFNFDIEYREGSANGNADTLSRYPVIPLRTQKRKKTQCSLGPDTLELVRRQIAAETKRAAVARPENAAVDENSAELIVNPEAVEPQEAARLILVNAVTSTPPGRAGMEPKLTPFPWVTLKTSLPEARAKWRDLKCSQRNDDFFGPMIRFLQLEILPNEPRMASVVLRMASSFALTGKGLLARHVETASENGLVLCIPKLLVPSSGRMP